MSYGHRGKKRSPEEKELRARHYVLNKAVQSALRSRDFQERMLREQQVRVDAAKDRVNEAIAEFRPVSDALYKLEHPGE